MARLQRKIDKYLVEWKNKKDKMPLIVKGARQIGKTDAIENFAKNNYKYIVEINFVLQKEYKTIFDNGYEVDTIISNISIINNNFSYSTRSIKLITKIVFSFNSLILSKIILSPVPILF